MREEHLQMVAECCGASVVLDSVKHACALLCCLVDMSLDVVFTESGGYIYTESDATQKLNNRCGHLTAAVAFFTAYPQAWPNKKLQRKTDTDPQLSGLMLLLRQLSVLTKRRPVEKPLQPEEKTSCLLAAPHDDASEAQPPSWAKAEKRKRCPKKRFPGLGSIFDPQEEGLLERHLCARSLPPALPLSIGVFLWPGCCGSHARGTTSGLWRRPRQATLKLQATSAMLMSSKWVSHTPDTPKMHTRVPSAEQECEDQRFHGAWQSRQKPTWNGN